MKSKPASRLRRVLARVTEGLALPEMTPEQEVPYRRAQDAIALERFRKGAPFGAVACVVVALLGSLGQGAPAAWTIRMGGTAAAIAALASIRLARASWVQARPNALFFSTSLVIAAAGALIAAHTGGFESAAIATVTLLWVFGSVITPLAPLAALIDAAGQLLVATVVILWASPRPGSPVMFAAINACGVALLFAGMTLRERADRRAFLVQQSLDQANGQLADMNVELERRVTEQVAEIRQRAEDIEGLNAQLQQRVIDRSRELAMALARLANKAWTDGSPVGEILNGRLELVRALDSGGMGEVFEAYDRVTRSRVAVKTIHSRRISDVTTLQRFLTEARAAAAVRHDAIVRTLDVDVTPNGTLFHVMELIEGETFADWLERAAMRPVGTIARVGHVVAGALAAAHAAGLVHRDIKPANIMLVATPPGAKVLDFGVAKLHDAGAAEDELVRTRADALLGTPAYMAPEQVLAPASVSGAADIYSLGVVIYEALSLKLPHEADSIARLFAAVSTAPPKHLRERCPAVPAELADLVMRCLERESGMRPSAATLAKELLPFVESSVSLGPVSRRIDAQAPTLEVEPARQSGVSRR
jgi:eukaryotic-like serine/threonine-protein kinase